jgi:nucleoside-diphosphate-sugar epimerase
VTNLSKPSKDNPRTRVTIVGCGDIGSRLAEQLKSEDYQIIGLRRSHQVSSLIDYRQVDCSSRSQLQQALPEHSDIIIITMTPSQRTDAGYQQAYVQVVDNLLEAIQRPPRLIVLVSSTSVYAQSQGEWIDEDSTAEPSSFSGKRLLEAEQRLGNSPYRSCIVRFSGIYGPKRQRLIEQVLRGESSPSLYSNRIHVDDCAAVLAHLIELDNPQALYLASDSSPTPLQEVKQWLAEQLGLPDNHWLKTGDSSLRASKRIRNQRLLDSGFTFSYPHFQQGYQTVIEQYRADKNLNSDTPKL